MPIFFKDDFQVSGTYNNQRTQKLCCDRIYESLYAFPAFLKFIVVFAFVFSIFLSLPQSKALIRKSDLDELIK